MSYATIKNKINLNIVGSLNNTLTSMFPYMFAVLHSTKVTDPFLYTSDLMESPYLGIQTNFQFQLNLDGLFLAGYTILLNLS